MSQSHEEQRVTPTRPSSEQPVRRPSRRKGARWAAEPWVPWEGLRGPESWQEVYRVGRSVGR